MKFSILALGAAVAGISCAHQCAAQSISTSPLSTSPPAVSLPFQSTQVDSTAQSLPPAVSNPSNDSAASGFEQLDMRKPLPVTKLGPAIDSLPDHLAAVLAQTPEVGIVPVVWPQGAHACATPNTVAAALMEKGCTDGLWATHAAQRECHCRRIQNVIHGHHSVNRYTAGNAACTCPQCQANTGVSNSVASGIQSAQSLVPFQAGPSSSLKPSISAPGGSPTAVHVAPVDASRFAAPDATSLPSPGLPAMVSPAVPQVGAPQTTPPVSVGPGPFVAPTPEFPSDLPSLPSLPIPPVGGGVMPAPSLPALPAFENSEPAASPGTAGSSHPLPDVPLQSADSLVAMKAKKKLP